MELIHTAFEESREDLGATARLFVAKELPEVRGWTQAGSPEVLAAVEAYNEKKRAACKARILANLSL